MPTEAWKELVAALRASSREGIVAIANGWRKVHSEL
jgi:hypothetical protein